jgi:hypothetical protein
VSLHREVGTQCRRAASSKSVRQSTAVCLKGLDQALSLETAECPVQSSGLQPNPGELFDISGERVAMFRTAGQARQNQRCGTGIAAERAKIVLCACHTRRLVRSAV